MRLLIVPFSGFSFFHITKVKQLLLLLILSVCLISLCCSKNKPTKPDDGLPHYWPRYTDMEPTWSPDGKTITYIHGGLDYPEDPAGIFLINIDGTNNRLFYEGASAYSPDFSPDGNWIVFSDYAQIFKIKLNRDSLTQLTFGGRNFFPDWSPDGMKISYGRSTNEPDTSADSSSSGIWIMDSNGTNKICVGAGEYPDWSLDSEKILCEIASYTPGNNYVDHYFWILSLEDTSHIRLPLVKGDNRYPVFSPDGKKIAFSSMYYSAPVIYVMDSDGKNLKLLTPEGGDNPSWSPDGKYIAYTYIQIMEGYLL